MRERKPRVLGLDPGSQRSQVSLGLGRSLALLGLGEQGPTGLAMPCSPITEAYTLGLHRDVRGLTHAGSTFLQDSEALHFLPDHPRCGSNDRA